MLAVSEQINDLKLLTKQVYERDTAKDKEYRRLKAFNKIIVKSNESTTQRELLQGILDSCIEFVNFDIGGIYLINGNTAKIIVTKYLPTSIIEELDAMCMTRPELQDLFLFGKPQYVRKYHEKYPRNSQLLGGIQTLIAIPILYDNRIRGCINIAAFTDRTITDEECDILRTLGKHLGHVLHRFEIEQQLELRLNEVEAYTEELRVSMDQLECERHNLINLFNTMTDMVFVLSYNGTICAINDAVRSTLGYPNGELIGQSITIVHDKCECMDIEHIMNQMITGMMSHCNMILVTKQNVHVKVDTRVVHGLWNNEQVIYSISREIHG